MTTPTLSDEVREIDLALAALVDVKPLADYGQPGTYDTAQARRRLSLAQAEQSLLNLRRALLAAQAQPQVRASILVNELVEQGKFFQRGDITEAEFIRNVNHYVSGTTAEPAGVLSMPDSLQVTAAWRRWMMTPDYKLAMEWADVPEHRDGALFCAFRSGLAIAARASSPAGAAQDAQGWISVDEREARAMRMLWNDQPLEERAHYLAVVDRAPRQLPNNQ